MKIGILGAGAGGLSSAYFLKNADADVRVYEASSRAGGLARSFKWHGFDCDIGPHRMYTENAELMGEMVALAPMHKVQRRSSIFIRGRWIRDPVNMLDLMVKFFPRESLEMVWTYLLRKPYPGENFEQVVLSKFGAGLHRLFFKPYSEKLFGMPSDQISATWAQRKLRVGWLKDLVRKNTKLYFDYFYYPDQGGYGAICESLYQRVHSSVHFNTALVGITPLKEKPGYACEFIRDGKTFVEEFDMLISSLALPMLGKMLGAAIDLKLRPARFVYLLLKKSRATDNQWFYCADGDFLINRLSEYKNFGAAGLPPDKTVLCCEITQVEHFSKERLIKELEATGILTEAEIEDIFTLDIDNAYPVYDLAYDEALEKAKTFFKQHPRIFNVGRNAAFEHKDTDDIFLDAKNTVSRIVSEYGITQRKREA